MEINDPIHGYITLEPYLKEFIDTPEFQRLRWLHQNGSAYLIFPGTSHRRFEHSIGVAHLAGRYLNHFQKVQPELEIDEFDIKSIKLAGLCHDLGHGPFSHLFDHEFMGRIKPELKWNHEQGSNIMLNHLINSNQIEIDEEMIKKIKNYIIGLNPNQSNLIEKGYLFDIVANQRNSMDVDKLDYIQRDTFNLNMKSSFDLNRLIQLSRVIDNQIGYDHKEVYNIYDLFRSRYNLFKKVCGNKTCRSIDMMITDVLILAEPTLKLSEMIFDPEQYLHLTDTILEDIAKSKIPELKPSQDIIKRIRKRQLYKLVDQVMIPKDKWLFINKNTVKPQDISTYQSTNDNLTPNDFVLDFFKITFGKGDQNPVEFVKFYSKKNLQVGYYLGKEEVSILVPNQFAEVSLRIFAREEHKVKPIQKAFRRWLSSVGLYPDPFLTLE